MTTITLKRVSKINKFSFNDEKELYDYLRICLELDFKEVDDPELSAEIREKIEIVDATPLADFINISTQGDDRSNSNSGN